jgi:hypothetical protein
MKWLLLPPDEGAAGQARASRVFREKAQLFPRDLNRIFSSKTKRATQISRVNLLDDD